MRAAFLEAGFDLISANGSRETQYKRARMLEIDAGGARVETHSNQDSSLLAVMSKADVLIRRMANAPALSSGDEIEYLPIG
ncbi:MAG: hypothetical protein AAFW68_05530 [Pseudomonadota bacterium]